MSCPDEDALFALISGRLPRERSDLIAAHADGCVGCQTALGEVARLVMGGTRRDIAPPTRPLLSGDVIADRFRLIALLGEGGAGVVWSASPMDGGWPVALKFLRRDDPRLVRRLTREARLASSLKHPNLVPVHELLALTDRAPALVMDLLVGESLAARLARGRVEATLAAAILAAVCDGVAALHGVSIVHRDLKPSNVFLVRDGEREEWPRVLDFGMAKQLGAANGTRPTTIGTLLGTPRYMAPEQLLAVGDSDERTDVWALGAILYETLAGVPHVSAHKPAHVMRAIVAGIRPLGEVAPEVPEAIASLAMRMLSVERNDRPTAAAAAATLRA